MSTSTKRLYNLLFVFGLVAFSVIFSMISYQTSSTDPAERYLFNLGLDLKGGVDLMLEVDRDQYQGEVRKEQMEGAIEVMRRKIDPGGVKEIVVQQVGDERIAVQVPGAKDPAAVKEIIGRPEALKWVDVPTDRPGPTVRQRVRFVNDVSQLEGGKGSGKEINPAAGTPPVPGEANEASTGVTPEVSTGVAPEGDSMVGTIEQTPEGGVKFNPVDITEGGTVQAKPSSGSDEEAPPGEEVKPGEEDDRYVVITDPNSDKNQIVITGEDLEMVQVTFYNNQPAVSFRIANKAAAKFSKHTGSHIGKQMAIILNDEVISSPVIRSRIGRQGQIEGFTADEAKQLEMLLNAGRIPVPLKVIQERTVSPTLGAESIRLSVNAGIWGLLAMLVFLFAYYRLPGLVADLSLLIYMVLFVGLMVMLKVTLTLPGIAGLILSLGMADDANVIIFERLKEEMKAGKTTAMAVRDAFKRAWAAILDSNVTTLISGFVLWWVGSGPIKGFAITLCLGVLLSMFTALFVTRNLLELFVSFPGLKKIWLAAGKGGN